MGWCDLYLRFAASNQFKSLIQNSTEQFNPSSFEITSNDCYSCVASSISHKLALCRIHGKGSLYVWWTSNLMAGKQGRHGFIASWTISCSGALAKLFHVRTIKALVFFFVWQPSACSSLQNPQELILQHLQL